MKNNIVTISEVSALIADFLAVPGKGRALARELAKALHGKPSDQATPQIAVVLLLAALLGDTPKEAMANAIQMFDFELFESFRFTFDQSESRGESESVELGPSYPRRLGEALVTVIDALRRHGSAPSQPYSVECGTKYAAPFVTITVQQIEPAPDGKLLQLEAIYATPGQTRIAGYQVPAMPRWGMSACGGDVFAKISKALGPLSRFGGGGLPVVLHEQALAEERRELEPLAANGPAALNAPFAGGI